MPELRQNEEVKINECEGLRSSPRVLPAWGTCLERGGGHSQVILLPAPRNHNFSTGLKSKLCSSKCALARLIREEGGEG